MKENMEPVNIEQLLSEADELIKQINSDSIKDMEEEYIIQFEKHAQELEKIKVVVKEKINKPELSEIMTSSEGVHEAIQDVLKAIRGLAKDIS
ncbi:conserved hypothetical protein [Desulfamplus magnetovallimortis]|uniref:Uncharacterized protein n=1 Tax=Desulfamplus magnetovallimortis TaxID=1246637 RepID=A0A1W1H7V7_9BACT|nr:hypothetical protein [Desulfamplus magnetovallimortis]SLM28516.1 conserved hypothetical protein [Desulfamplus magnetovallimortis]